MLRYIEGYVQKVSPAKAPAVVGALLDCEAPDEFINNLILSVSGAAPFPKPGIHPDNVFPSLHCTCLPACLPAWGSST
jgi:hypothetical protein